MAYQNGRIPTSALRRSVVGVTLRADAAESADRLAADFQAATGTRLVATDGYRALSGHQWAQEEIFLARYEPRASGRGPFGDVRWWRGVRYVRVRGAAAAIPGTSNHGLGLALDLASGVNAGFDTAAYKALAKIAPAHGWSNAEGRAVREPWHWVYDPTTDTHPGRVTALPIDLPEDRMRRTRHTRTKDLALPLGWKTLPINDKGHTSACTVVGRGTLVADLTLTGVPKGREVQVRAIVVESDPDGKNAKVIRRGSIVEIIGTGGQTFGQIVAPFELEKINGRRQRRVRIQALALDKGVRLTHLTTTVDYIPA